MPIVVTHVMEVYVCVCVIQTLTSSNRMLTVVDIVNFNTVNNLIINNSHWDPGVLI